MKFYMEVGERGHYKLKRYTCREWTGDADKRCEYCDLNTTAACYWMRCCSAVRTDRKNVVFQRAHHKRGSVSIK